MLKDNSLSFYPNLLFTELKCSVASLFLSHQKSQFIAFKACGNFANAVVMFCVVRIVELL